MATVCKTNVLTVANKVGRLAELTDKIKDAGVNIVALLAWVKGDTGHLQMVAEDAEKVCDSLRDHVDTCAFGEAVCVNVPNTPGALNEVAHKLAEAGIGIDKIYATAGDAAEASIVLSTTDNAKAAELL